MPNFLVNLPEPLLARMLAETQARGTTMETFIAEAIAQALTTPEFTERKVVSVKAVLAGLVDEAQKIRPGETFLVKDLCNPDDWNSLSAGERKNLGKSFRKKVEDKLKPIAKWVDRTSGNQAIYERV